MVPSLLARPTGHLALHGCHGAALVCQDGGILAAVEQLFMTQRAGSRSRDWWRLANHSVTSGVEEGMQRRAGALSAFRPARELDGKRPAFYTGGRRFSLAAGAACGQWGARTNTSTR